MSPAQKAIDLVATLGGPSLDPEVLTELENEEAGKLLLDWIGDQLSDDFVDSDSEGDQERDRRIQAAMRNTFLEVEEVMMLNELECELDDASQPQLDYLTPLQLRKRADMVKLETTNVKKEEGYLRSRVARTKAASTRLKSNIKKLQRAIFDADAEIRASEAKLTELSLASDTGIITALVAAQKLLEALGGQIDTESADDEDSNPLVKDCRIVILDMKAIFNSIMADIKENTTRLDSLHHDSMNRKADLQLEAKRLQKSLIFDSHFSDSTRDFDGVLEHDVALELINICDELEHAAGSEGDVTSKSKVLDRLLSELDESTTGCDGESVLNDYLRKAWVMDQTSILRAHQEVLCKASTTLETILEPLRRIHASLATVVHHIQESEAALEVFVEELGDITVNTGPGNQADSIAVADGETENKIKDVFNNFKEMCDIGPFSALTLTREDILEKLRLLKQRSKDIEKSEKAWCKEILNQHTGDIQIPDGVYANAPLNTSPPFSYPRDVLELEDRTRRRLCELQQLANSVEEDVLRISAHGNALKHMDKFIERNCGSSTD